MDSYNSRTTWRRYGEFFDREMDASEAESIEERVFHFRGARIHLDHYRADASPITVLALHGAGGYGRMLWPYLVPLHRSGYDVVAPDLPGYGLSDAPAELFSYSVWVELVVALVEELYQTHNRPVVLFGASVGGFLAYMVAARSLRVSGLVVTTLADPRDAAVRERFGRNRWITRWGIPLLPVMAKVAGSLAMPIRWFTRMHAMSNTPALTQLVIRDALGGGNRVPVSFMQSMFSAVPALEPENFTRCPVLLVHPAVDRWTGVEISQPFFDRLAGPKSLVMLEDCGHFPVEAPGVEQLEKATRAFLAGISPGH